MVKKNLNQPMLQSEGVFHPPHVTPKVVKIIATTPESMVVARV